MKNYNIRTDTVFVKAVADALKISVNEHDLTREICISPFDGHYGRAGFIININGSPPIATLILYTNEDKRLVGIKDNNRNTVAADYTGSEAMKWLRDYLLVHIKKIDG